MKLRLLLIAMLALAHSAVAQENPAKLALAREVVTAMQADKMLDGMFGQIKQMALQSMPIPADATPEQRKKAEAMQNKMLDVSMEAAKSMVSKMDHLYADVYSEAELVAIKTFFNSPEGKSMIAKQPQVMAKVMPLVQEMQKELMPKLQKIVQDAQAAEAPAPAAPAAK